MKTAAQNPPKRPARTRRKYRTDEYRGWKLRYIVPKPGDKHTTPYWIADNCDRRNRKRAVGDTRADAVKRVDEIMGELETHGTAHSLNDDLRAAALRAVKVAGDRATLDEIVKFWAERHPTDGNKIGLGEMARKFISERETLGNRPATIRAIRQKMATFTNAIGAKTAIAGIWEDDVARFMAGQNKSIASRREWRKVLVLFFRWCVEKGAMKTNPAFSIVIPKTIKKPPSTWAARDVESFMRIAEHEAPEMVAGFAILWWAGLRPTELCGQYGLEDARIADAKKKLAQARTNYEAEKMRLGLVRGRGADTAKQAANRAKLEASQEKQALAAAQDHLARMQARHGGEALPGLQWADICLDDPEERFISIRAETSKVQERRHVEIFPNLETWLRKYRRIGGPVAANPTAFRRARKRILAKMPGARWCADVCRHTFASYHYKAHGDRDRLAAAMGHTAMSREIEKHYKDATVSRADAEKYWQIVPDSEATAETEKRTARKGA